MNVYPRQGRHRHRSPSPRRLPGYRLLAVARGLPAAVLVLILLTVAPARPVARDVVGSAGTLAGNEDPPYLMGAPLAASIGAYGLAPAVVEAIRATPARTKARGIGR